MNQFYGMGGVPDLRRQPIGMMGSSIPGLGSLFGQNNAMTGPSAGIGSPTFDEMDSSGGVNVLGSLAKHGNYGTRFQSSPASYGD